MQTKTEIVDHDSVEAYTAESYNYAKKNNIALIPAVEISTKILKCGIHILGDMIDVNSKFLIESLRSIRNSRHEYLHNVAKKLENNCPAYVSKNTVTPKQAAEMIRKAGGRIQLHISMKITYQKRKLKK